jgi:hydroxypyruvate isomerase
MRLSCADSSFPMLSRSTALAVIADLNLPGFDLCLFGVEGTSFFPLDDALSDPARAAGRARRLADDAGLAISDVFGIYSGDFRVLAANHPSADERAESRKRCLALLDYAAAVGSPGLTTLPGMPFDGEDAPTSRKRAAAELQWRAEQAAERGLRFSVEPHVQSIIETPDETLALLADAPDVKLALDPSHQVYLGFTIDDLEPLVPYTAHVHARQAAKGAMQLPLGEGTIDFVAFIKMLERGGYDRWLCIEYQWEEWLDCNRVDCISETALLRDLLTSVIAG